MSATLTQGQVPVTPNEEKVFADDQVENVDTVKQDSSLDEHVQRPETLRGMSDADIKVLDKKMVRKLDFVIMPIMGILYILNCK